MFSSCALTRAQYGEIEARERGKTGGKRITGVLLTAASPSATPTKLQAGLRAYERLIID